MLLSGTAGTGKTTLAAQFVDAACARGEKCLYFLFEESPSQMIRNMRSAGIDLQKWVDKGLLKFHADRPNRHGLETHLLEMHHAVEVFEPDVVVRRSDHQSDGGRHAVRRARDAHARHRLPEDAGHHRGVHQPDLSTQSLEATESMISSLWTPGSWWLSPKSDRKRNRWIYVLKSRGMPHSDEVREFDITDRGSIIRREPRQPHGRRAASQREETQMSDETSRCGCTSPGRRRRPCARFANLRKICDEHLAGRYSIEVIDLVENPALGRGDQILALPTLVRRLPAPIKKIIGDLSNTERVLVGLDLRPRRPACE